MIYRGTLTGTVFVIHTDIWHTVFCVFRGRSQAVKTKYLPATATVKVAKTYPSAQRLDLCQTPYFQRPVTSRDEKKKQTRKNKVTAPMKGLGCPKRSENIINRKMRCFYIEAISKKNLRTNKKCFFERS